MADACEFALEVGEEVAFGAALKHLGEVGAAGRQDLASELGGDFGITTDLTITLQGLDKAKAEAQKPVDSAHQICPYSNATRGNVDVGSTIA